MMYCFLILQSLSDLFCKVSIPPGVLPVIVGDQHLSDVTPTVTASIKL